MTILHELVFSFEDICHLYNIVEKLLYIIYQLNKMVCFGLHHSLQ